MVSSWVRSNQEENQHLKVGRQSLLEKGEFSLWIWKESLWKTFNIRALKTTVSLQCAEISPWRPGSELSYPHIKRREWRRFGHLARVRPRWPPGTVYPWRGSVADSRHDKEIWNTWVPAGRCGRWMNGWSLL